MLNLKVGSQVEIDGRTCIQTLEGAAGHAIYGPYEVVAPGTYAVQFEIAFPQVREGLSGTCAVMDIATESGTAILASHTADISKVGESFTAFYVTFKIDKPTALEYRVFTTGLAPLLIGAYCRPIPLPEQEGADLGALFFPNVSRNVPVFFEQNLKTLRGLYEEGVDVRILNNDVVLKANGVSFFARTYDDIRFVREIFFSRVYNVELGDKACVIDIGMNIGLVSLGFATKSWVVEVHSFEPFQSTFSRAVDNLELNQKLARKIFPNNFGLADEDAQLTILVPDESDSGLMSIRSADAGVPKQIVVKDAARTLRPIIENAKAKGLQIVAKIDCEGAEFPIFDRLESDGLLHQLSAVMVEWHRVFPDKTQADLIGPLLKHGFLVVDLTPPAGNGFFYAVNTRVAPSRT